ncbi:MAG: RNA polymerase sigma factor [Salibacteraceae bacterium]|mgnify:CR=1 FL=1
MFDLTEELRKKDEKAIGILYTRYGKKLYGHAITQWKLEEDDAWDVVYKTLYKVIASMEHYSFEDENRFIGFVFKVFTNYLRNHLRDTKGKRLLATPFLETHEGLLKSEEPEEQKEDVTSPIMRCLKKVLAELEDWKRILLLMRAQNFSYKEIAPYTNRPEKQLKVYHLRLRTAVLKNTNACVDKKGYES